MCANTLGISFAHEFRRNFDGFASLKILEQHIVPEFRIELLLVEHLEQDHILPVPGERTYACEQVLGIAIEIRDHCNQSPALYLLPEFVEWLVEASANCGFRRIDAM